MHIYVELNSILDLSLGHVKRLKAMHKEGVDSNPSKSPPGCTFLFYHPLCMCLPCPALPLPLPILAIHPFAGTQRASRGMF